MKKEVRIKISEYCLAPESEIIKSYGLGSCIGLALWDPKKKIGALAHILLPSSRNSRPRAGSARYASSAVSLMLEEMIKAGCRRDRLVAKVAGGANMFPARFNPAADGPGLNIGKRNIQAVRRALARKKIPIAGQEVGGEIGRTIEFNPQTGELRVYKSTGEVKII